MKKIAIIDIGSNSIRLVLFEVYKNSSFRVIDDIKESPRLGEGLLTDGNMKEENMNRAIEALKLFKSLCEHNEADTVLAFGTAAVRSAQNASIFLDRVNKECGIDVRVLSGEEEANFSFYGAINSLDITEGLLIDMGGSSCELVHFVNREIKNSISLNFGSLSIMEKFSLKDELNLEKKSQISDYVQEEFDKVLWLKDVADLPLVGVGGTIRNLGKIHMKMKNYPIENLHNYFISSEGLNELYEFIGNKNYKEKQKIEGLAKSRADIITGASFVFNKLVEFANLNGVVISGKGIREGFLYGQINENGKEIDDVFHYGLFNVCERYKISREHGMEIFRTFMDLFIKLQPLHKIDEPNLKIINSLCYLCLSGINISYYDHDLHSFYTILNSRLDGVSHKELLVTALASSQQNKRNTMYESYKRLLNETDIHKINVYGLLISFAKTFNRTHGREVKNIDVKYENNSIYLELDSSESIALEMKMALDSAKRFEKLFNKKLYITRKNS